jgi:hypothetical protein
MAGRSGRTMIIHDHQPKAVFETFGGAASRSGAV